MSTTRLWISALVLGAMSTTAYSQTPGQTPGNSPDPTSQANDPRVPQTPTYPTDTTPTTTAPTTQTPIYMPVPVYPTEPQPVEHKTAFERLGLSLAAGGGVEGFTDNSMRGTANDGGGWDVRATFGTRSFLSFEAEYLGSAQSIDALGLDSNALLVSNGAQGALRVNFLRKAAVQPFVFAGVAWRRYNVTNTSTNLSDINDEDDVLEIPAGLGIATRWKGLVFDARGEFRAATDNDLMPRFDIGGLREHAAMHRYGVNASIGYEF